MNWQVGLIALALTTSTLQAHEMWVIPSEKGDGAAVAWSDDPEPDGVDEKITTIASAKVFMRRGDDKIEELKWREEKDIYRLTCAGDDTRTVAAIWDGDGCLYFAKAYLPGKDGKFVFPEKPKAWDRLLLEIIPRSDRDIDAYQVLFKGKPLAGAHIVACIPNMKKSRFICDADGQFRYAAPKSGPFAFRVFHRPGNESYASTLMMRAPTSTKK